MEQYILQLQAELALALQALAMYKMLTLGLVGTNIITAIALFRTLRVQKVQQSKEHRYDSANDSPLDMAA